jgi:glycosyltransferase involved in cell wall biosynthesis
MPVHNGAETLTEAISSILEQTCREFEFIIVDDGSTDATPDILSRVRDRRVQIVRLDKNLGIVRALQIGIAASSGDFVARMDADDLSLPNRLAIQRSYLEERPGRGLVGTSFALSESAARSTAGSPLGHAAARLQLHFGNVIAHSSAVFSRKLYDIVGGYRQEAWPAEDYDLWLRMSKEAEIGVLARPLIVYTLSPDGISHKNHELQVQKTIELSAGALTTLLSRDVDLALVTKLIRYLPPADSHEMSELQDFVLDAYAAVRRDCVKRGIRVEGSADAAARILHLIRYRDASGNRCWKPLAQLPFTQPRVGAALLRTRVRWKWSNRQITQGRSRTSRI